MILGLMGQSPQEKNVRDTFGIASGPQKYQQKAALWRELLQDN
jgi:hypothetical protein